MESIFRKAVLPLLVGSTIMMGLFSLAWFRHHNQVQTLTLSTGSASGQYYAFGQALAKIVAKHNPNFRLEVIDSDGALENTELLQEEKADLAIVQSDTSVSPSIKAVSFLFPEVFHLIVRQESGIKQINDLKGKRIALMPKDSGSYQLFWVLSHHYELDETDLEAISMTPQNAQTALIEGKVDGLFQVIALGNPGITELLQNPQLKLIPIDQASALRLTLPALEDTQIPKGTYSGASPIPSEDLPGVGVKAVLVAHKRLKQETIFELTRLLHEARNDLVREFTQAAMISDPETHRNRGFSFHPGASAYYNQGKPSFIVKYAEPIGLLISVSVLFISTIWQLRMWLQSKQKNRADLYNLEILRVIEKIDGAKDLEELNDVREQLLKMLETVIIDLDKDRISPESFQSFTFPWDVALSSIRHRENMLNNRAENDM